MDLRGSSGQGQYLEELARRGARGEAADLGELLDFLGREGVGRRGAEREAVVPGELVQGLGREEPGRGVASGHLPGWVDTARVCVLGEQYGGLLALRYCRCLSNGHTITESKRFIYS